MKMWSPSYVRDDNKNKIFKWEFNMGLYMRLLGWLSLILNSNKSEWNSFQIANEHTLLFVHAKWGMNIDIIHWLIVSWWAGEPAIL